MEIAGLAVGGIGLAGIFSACKDCFELIHQGQYLGEDFCLLETKFANQRLRLTSWGKACGFAEDSPYQTIKLDDEAQECLARTLLELHLLLSNGTQLREKYGLRQHIEASENRRALISPLKEHLYTTHTWLNQLRRRVDTYRAAAVDVQKRTSFTDCGKWVIKDHRKFADLVRNMTDLINDLDIFTIDLGLQGRQRDIIQAEVESIVDVRQLEMLEVAHTGPSDVISDAASLRLSQMRNEDHDSQHQNEAQHHPAIRSIREWEEIPIEPNKVANQGPRAYQTIYRVQCSDMGTSLFLDMPAYNNHRRNDAEWLVFGLGTSTPASETLHLAGNRPLKSLATYLTNNSSLAFVLIRTHICDHDLRSQQQRARHEERQSIYLSSIGLCSWLQDQVCESAPGHTRLALEPGSEIAAPYYSIYHSKILQSYRRNSLRLPGTALKAEQPETPRNTEMTPEQANTHATQNKVKDDMLNMQVEELLEVLTESMMAEYDAIDRLLGLRMIKWQHLEYLYRPNDIVLVNHTGGIRSCQGFELVGQPRLQGSGKEQKLVLPTGRWHFDGRFRYCSTALEIPHGLSSPIDQTISLDALPALPLRFCEKISQDQLYRRGLNVWKSRNPRYVAWTSTDTARNSGEFEERFMIDYHAHRTLIAHPQDDLPPCFEHELDNATLRATNPPSGSFLYLLPASITGHDPTTHDWRKLDVVDIDDVVWNKTAFDQALILPENQKELLRATVNSCYGMKLGHQVVLFHGAPGTGKTYAAQSLAETMERPLYTVRASNCSQDLSTWIDSLKEAARLASTWEALLLIEDVDVLFEERQATDATRNSLVIAALELVESFRDTVLLTTNRVGTLDEALNSRCSYTIHFEPLSTEARKAIWINAIRNLRSNTHGTSTSEGLLSNVDDLSRHEMNGHKIKNALNTASRVALSRASPLDCTIVKEVVDGYDNWQKYTNEIRGGTKDEERARLAYLR